MPTPSFIKTPSPVQEIHFSETEEKGIRLFIKRDDLIHPEISGNKWRKLQYNLEDARIKKQNTILTFGGAFSNHIAATAACGKLMGFPSIGIIRGEEPKEWSNTLVKAKENGMQLHFISRETYRQYSSSNWEDIANTKEALRNLFGSFYMIPEGGANYLGVNGSMEIVKELEEEYDFIALACGTGTTLSGVLLKSPAHSKILAFPVLKGGEFIGEDVKNNLHKVFNNSDLAFDFLQRMNILPEYHFGGYAKIDAELISFMRRFYFETGVKLDPVYTAKAAYGLVDQIKKEMIPRESKVLFIHTGGMQGLEGIEARIGYSIYSEL